MEIVRNKLLLWCYSQPFQSPCHLHERGQGENMDGC